MALVQDDHVVQAFTADTPNQPLDVWVLPRAPGGDDHVFNPVRPENPKLFIHLTFFACLLMLDEQTLPSSDTP
jgi:hypothetical protein